MDSLKQLANVFLHLDKFLNEGAGKLGVWTYALLFAVVFCETGLVVTPFLPGDSLLFAVGALSAAPDSPIQLGVVIGLLFVAGVLGDAVNYSIGLKVGPGVFKSDSSRLFNKKHLAHTQAFYERHGGKTIILARFVPIVRTFAPFVAGVGKMSYGKFAQYNLVGAALWVVLLTVAGRLFGDIPFVKKHFELVVLAIIFLSILPGIVEFLRTRKASASAPAEPAP